MIIKLMLIIKLSTVIYSFLEFSTALKKNDCHSQPSFIQICSKTIEIEIRMNTY